MRSFAVIPGAGLSQRMGTSKLLLPWGNSTVIENLLGQWHLSTISQIVLVTRPECVAGLDQAKLAALDRVHVLTPEPTPVEMKASVLKALEFIKEQWSPQPEDVWLLAPADLATLTAEMIDRVIEVFAASEDRYEMAIPSYRDRRGHPVLFTWRLAMEVSRLAASENLRSLTDRTFPRVEIAMPGQAPRDVDTWDDYQALKPVGTPDRARPH